MNGRRLSLLMTAAAVLTSAHLAGQARSNPPQPPGTPYYDRERGTSLEEAIARAIEREPALRAARTDIDAARGLRLQAGLRPNPTLSVERREEPGGTDHQTSVSFEWPLDLFRKAGRVDVAERSLEVARYAVADRERILAAEVRMAYGQVLTAIRTVTVSDEIIAATRRQFGVVRARVDEGATPPLERDLLDVEVRRIEAERLSNVSRSDVAMVELKRLMGLDPTTGLTVRETLEDVVLPEPMRSPRSVSDRPVNAVGDRSDVREAKMRERLAAAQVDSARREGRFDVSVTGSYMRMDAGFPQRGFTPAGTLERVRGLFNYAAVGAMVTVPLRDRHQGAIAAAEAQRAGAGARHDAIQLAAHAELAAAQARDANARRAVTIYTGAVRQLAQQNLAVVGQIYELGRATVFDFLAEQRRYLDVERTYTDVLREAYEARTALTLATGDVQ